ncbi:hypothetical protein TraAM80_03393 [Trypanosoma rangeli]|uniref:Uncharacterized protein n=1 Tax=Trypanosoma rangeli TaxID=5698 RepID=A0A422NPA8_TRYRA|nr:uncharacterized protein TraAM80_03393 [Trypanosoma rangeli]RNF07271.1 hypothetical protein TraAM80_03393 [Trypanosoma rangeli]|eukprot:RNF07271.1 hypothetical protein TraAM80_03393 [Trypanosoma rangeli]
MEGVDGMLTTPDEVEKVLAAAQTDSCLASREAADALHQRISGLCEAQCLAHNRHCRRIYNTLCRFLKPEEVVQRRQTSVALCHVWKSAASNCDDVVAEILSRLMDAKPVSNTSDEGFTVTLLLALIAIDLRDVGEGVAAMERALQHLRTDTGRGKAGASDMAAQRKALQRRRVQRIMTLQADRDYSAQLLKEASHQLGQLMLQSRQLHASAESQRVQMHAVDVLARVDHDPPKCYSVFNLQVLHQLGLDLATHEMAQSDLLAKTRHAQEDMEGFPGDSPSTNPIHAPAQQENLEAEVGNTLETLSANDPAVSLRERVERLLNAAWIDGRDVRGGGLVKESCEDDLQPFDSTSPALTTHLLWQQRHAVKRTPPMTPSHRLCTTRRDTPTTVADDSRNWAPHGACGTADTHLQMQDKELSQRHRQGDAAALFSDAGFTFPAPSYLGGNNVLESSTQTSRSDRCPHRDAYDLRYSGAKELRLQPASHFFDSAAVTPLQCGRCGSPLSERPMPAQSCVPTGGLSGDCRQSRITTQPSYRSTCGIEERKPYLTRSKALLLARIKKLAHMSSKLLPSDKYNIAFATS